MAPAQDFEVDDNRIVLLSDGAERLEALIALIDGARRSLRLLYYIFLADGTGKRVRDAAIAACGRGVAVALLIDGFGSDPAPDAFFAPLEAAGASVCRFLPRFGRRYLLRNHQKMAIADGETDARKTIVGGFNVADDYFTPEGWRDFGVLVEGRAVAHLASYFDAVFDWAAGPRPKIRTLNRIITRYSQRAGRVRWLLGGPTQRFSPWARAVKREIRRAHRLDLIAAYFAPNPGLLRAIRRLARRGTVRIVTAAKSDNSTTVAAARHTYARLLRRGARVFEYQPVRLHTKLFVIDEAGFVGSANCDMRSLYINCEVMLRVEDAGFAAALRSYVDGEISQSREARLDLLRERAGWWTRTRWSFAYFLVAVVDYTVTRRLNFKSGTGEIAD
jgi:cardiolipin synthase A/B